MLPSDYFAFKEDRLLQLYSELENFILRDITRRKKDVSVSGRRGGSI